MSRGARTRQRGLSLIELLVAFTIMAMAIGMLYRAAGGSVRSVGDAEAYQRALLLADSLVQSRDAVPPGGIDESGTSAGFAWRVRSEPYATTQPSPPATPLQQVWFSVSWSERDTPKRLEFSTLLPQRRPEPGAGAAR